MGIICTCFSSFTSPFFWSTKYPVAAGDDATPCDDDGLVICEEDVTAEGIKIFDEG